MGREPAPWKKGVAQLHDLAATRRHFFGQCRIGLGAIALQHLLFQDAGAKPALDAARLASDPLAPRPAPFCGHAKRVIYLFMAGGPSQFELFDF
jgi:hypothetical protein